MIIDYVEKVKSGEILACKYVRQAIDRFEKDLQRDQFIFIPEAAERVIDFFSRLEHFAGKFEGKKFILTDWQKFVVYNLYGFYYKDTGRRRFRTAYLELARKQGKTALAAGLCLYHLVADNEGSPEVLLAANSREQANIAFDITRKFARRADPNEQFLKVRRNDILFDAADGLLKVLAADADKLDGYNCSFAFVDEYHSAPTPRVRDVLRSGQGLRTNPMLMTVTTAGFDKSLPCYELRTVCTEILSGTKVDDSVFTMIYTLDQGDDWHDKKTWVKSNPNLGVTVTEDWLQEQVNQAINNPSDEVGVLTKNLNIWCDSAETWIPDVYVLEATKEIDLSIYDKQQVYVGVDLATNYDLAAVSFLAEVDGMKYFYTRYYLPAESLLTRPDKELYKQWHRKKHLNITPGNVTDYNYITHDILKFNEEHDCFIVMIAYDPYNSTQWATRSTEEGLPLEKYSQTIGNFNKPTKEFERLILGGKMYIDDNPVNRFCLRNVELRRDWNGNIKPDKSQEKKKIDGVIAMLQALAMYQEYHREYNLKVY